MDVAYVDDDWEDTGELGNNYPHSSPACIKVWISVMAETFSYVQVPALTVRGNLRVNGIKTNIRVFQTCTTQGQLKPQ